MDSNLRVDKRPLEEIDTNSDSNKKKKKSGRVLTVPYSVYSAKEKECLTLLDEINRYQQTWMRK